MLNVYKSFVQLLETDYPQGPPSRINAQEMAARIERSARNLVANLRNSAGSAKRLEAARAEGLSIACNVVGIALQTGLLTEPSESDLAASVAELEKELHVAHKHIESLEEQVATGNQALNLWDRKLDAAGKEWMAKLQAADAECARLVKENKALLAQIESAKAVPVVFTPPDASAEGEDVPRKPRRRKA